MRTSNELNLIVVTSGSMLDMALIQGCEVLQLARLTQSPDCQYPNRRHTMLEVYRSKCLRLIPRRLRDPKTSFLESYGICVSHYSLVVSTVGCYPRRQDSSSLSMVLHAHHVLPLSKSLPFQCVKFSKYSLEIMKGHPCNACISQNPNSVQPCFANH